MTNYPKTNLYQLTFSATNCRVQHFSTKNKLQNSILQIMCSTSNYQLSTGRYKNWKWWSLRCSKIKILQQRTRRKESDDVLIKFRGSMFVLSLIVRNPMGLKVLWLNIWDWNILELIMLWLSLILHLLSMRKRIWNWRRKSRGSTGGIDFYSRVFFVWNILWDW